VSVTLVEKYRPLQSVYTGNDDAHISF